jgi:alpha-ketoglutarate-dependent taurine dioxygenase
MEPLIGAEAWRAEDIVATDRWRINLSPVLAQSLAAAATAAVVRSPSVTDIGRHCFEAPSAAALFDRMHAEIEQGAGFVVLGGLPVEDLDYQQQVALTLGMCDHVGHVVPQNFELQRIVDVRDEGVEYSHRSRGYRGNKALPFHTDGAHLFSLTCLGTAAAGGETIIVSASAVYNEIASHHPQSLDVLHRGFYHHRRGQHEPGESPLSETRIPVFSFNNGLLHCCYNRNPIEWAVHEGVTLSAEETAALDTLDAVLARRDMQLRLNLKPGECAFVNNFITLHSRTEYADSAEHRRHMLRVWMSDPRSRRDGVSLLQLYVPEAHVRAALDSHSH